MAVLAKRPATGLIRSTQHWLQRWLAEARPRATQQSATDYQLLALSLAAADQNQLCQQLAGCQQRLRYLLNNRHLNLFVLLADVGQAEAGLLHGNDHAPEAALQKNIKHQLQWLTQHAPALHARQETEPMQDIIESASVESGTLTFQPIPINAESEPAWMILYFPHTAIATPTADTHLQSLTRPMRQAFSQGLSIYQQRQRAVMQALSTERKAQAAELHDSLAQVLGYLRIRSARLQSLCTQDEYAALEEISQDVASQTLLAYRQVRELIGNSRLSVREQSLDQAITSAVKEFEQHSAIVFEVDNRCPDTALNSQQITQLSYIVRESLANIVRHAHASHARIRLSRQHNTLRLFIEDNGCGINPDAARSDSFGLAIMQERATRIQAKFRSRNRHGGGTSIQLTLGISA